MKISFRKKDKRSDTSAGPKRIEPLQQACKEFRKPELYVPLSQVLILNPRLAERYFDEVLKRRRYRAAGGVMLYRSNLEEARRYYTLALKAAQGDAAKQRLTITLQNLSTVAKIARRLWELTGKYQPLQKPPLQHFRKRR